MTQMDVRNPERISHLLLSKTQRLAKLPGCIANVYHGKARACINWLGGRGIDVAGDEMKSHESQPIPHD